MSFPKRDWAATVLVAVIGILYGIWAAGAAPSALDSVRETGLVILALGFAASAVAVVPGFDQVIHGNKAYLAATSVLGLGALAAGLQMLLGPSEVALGILVGLTGVLWLVATMHHAALARTRPRPALAERPRRAPAGPHGRRHRVV